jgi:hypothetical protein
LTAGVVNHHFGLVLLWRVHSSSTLLHDLFLFSGMFAAGASSSNSDWSKLSGQTGISFFALPTQQPSSTKTLNRAPSQAMQGGFSNLATAPGKNLFAVGGANAPAPSPAFGGAPSPAFGGASSPGFNLANTYPPPLSGRPAMGGASLQGAFGLHGGGTPQLQNLSYSTGFNTADFGRVKPAGDDEED